MKNRFIIFIFILLGYPRLTAQNMTNSPGSMFGLGEILTGDGGLYAGMGGASIALRSSNFLNSGNPASLSGMGEQKFIFSLGAMGAIKEFTQNNARSISMVGNISNTGAGFRVMPRWYTALTINPVSSVGYFITLDQQVDGSPGSTITSQFEGQGGLTRMTFSNAFMLTKRLTAGVNLSYTTGSVTETERQGSATIEEQSEKQAVHADFGLQYVHNLSKTQTLTLGAIYGYSQRLAQENTLTVTSTSSTEIIAEDQRAARQYLPGFYGLGIAYNSPRWIATAEYKYLDWSKMQSGISMIRYDNQHKLSLGTSYIIGNMYKLPKQLMVGAGYYNSYVVISNEKPLNYYLSAGIGFTVPNGSIVTIGLKYNDQFNVSASTQKERAFSLFLNLTFNERTYRSKLR